MNRQATDQGRDARSEPAATPDEAKALARIVLPQSIRVIIPPTGNQFIGMLKATSLVSVIGGSDLLTRIQLIYGQNFKILPLLIVAVLWYLILVTVASIGQFFLERRFNNSQPGSRRARKGAGTGSGSSSTTTTIRTMTGGALWRK